MPAHPSLISRHIRVLLFVALSAQLFACGDVRGQAIIQSSVPGQSTKTGNSGGNRSGSGGAIVSYGSGGASSFFGGAPSYQGQGGFRHDSPRASAAGSGQILGPHEPPICQPCREHRDCPLNDSFCIRDPGAVVGFCGFGCSRDECPAGHACAFLDGLPIPQCVPVAGTCPATTGNTLGGIASQIDMQVYNLMLLNRFRMERGLTPLTWDACLSHEAEIATSDWVRSNQPHRYFANSCEPVKPDCACGWREENQGYSDSLLAGWQDSLQHIIEDEVRNHPNEGFANNIFSPDLERVGIGIIVSEQKLWLTNAFGAALPLPPPPSAP